VAEDVKRCVNCEQPLADRVEEEVRTGTAGSASTGQCATYRVWACANPECVMYRTDLYKEIISGD